MKGDQAEELMKEMRGGRAIKEQRVERETPGLKGSEKCERRACWGAIKGFLLHRCWPNSRWA